MRVAVRPAPALNPSPKRVRVETSTAVGLSVRQVQSWPATRYSPPTAAATARTRARAWPMMPVVSSKRTQQRRPSSAVAIARRRITSALSVQWLMSPAHGTVRLDHSGEPAPGSTHTPSAVRSACVAAWSTSHSRPKLHFGAHAFCRCGAIVAACSRAPDQSDSMQAEVRVQPVSAARTS
ncbi:hypothetical protein C2U72_03395 [Prosthecomicrobium hirschii]|nr:hypothetical protein C2U72_03395 [Prosthecomicrobium hirschii]